MVEENRLLFLQRMLSYSQTLSESVSEDKLLFRGLSTIEVLEGISLHLFFADLVTYFKQEIKKEKNKERKKRQNRRKNHE
jgi:hypothetical protein